MYVLERSVWFDSREKERERERGREKREEAMCELMDEAG